MLPTQWNPWPLGGAICNNLTPLLWPRPVTWTSSPQFHILPPSATPTDLHSHSSPTHQRLHVFYSAAFYCSCNAIAGMVKLWVWHPMQCGSCATLAIGHLLSDASRSSLGRIQPPVQWVMGTPSQDVRCFWHAGNLWPPFSGGAPTLPDTVHVRHMTSFLTM
jgi:hypothetical protein